MESNQANYHTFLYSPHIHSERYEIVSRNLINYYIHKFVDILEIIAQQIAKIVLVEDSKTTGLVCLLSGFIYLATSLVPTKVFFGLFVLALFTVPYYYEEHQEIVDEKVNMLVKKLKATVDKYSTVVRRNSATFYEYYINLVQQQLAKTKAVAATAISSRGGTKATIATEEKEAVAATSAAAAVTAANVA